jgi:hypothetical protein
MLLRLSDSEGINRPTRRAVLRRVRDERQENRVRVKRWHEAQHPWDPSSSGRRKSHRRQNPSQVKIFSKQTMLKIF